jgi:hypothetical protein
VDELKTTEWLHTNDAITHDPLRMLIAFGFHIDAIRLMKNVPVMSVCMLAINREWLDGFS